MINNKQIVFTFPGQGAYHFSVLRELYASFPETHDYFRMADDISRRFLQQDFLPLITAPSQVEHDEVLLKYPNLDQVGIYLTEVSIAGLLIRAGLKPGLLVGHSFGELAALAVAGAYSIETGFKIVCQRILALQEHGGSGGMAAVSCDALQAKEIIENSGVPLVSISVSNHAKQTVLSGAFSDLRKLETTMSLRGICLTLLKSRYPFHSHLLEKAVKPFRASLAVHDFQPPVIPLLLCTEEKLYSRDVDLSDTLSSHFVRPLNFRSIVNSLYKNGFRIFVECGAGDILTKLAMENLKDKEDVRCFQTTKAGIGIKQGLDEMHRQLVSDKDEKGIVDAILAPLPQQEFSAQQAQQMMLTMLSNLSVIVQNLSTLVENTTTLMQFVAQTGIGNSLQVLPAANNGMALTKSLSVIGYQTLPHDAEQIFWQTSSGNDAAATDGPFLREQSDPAQLGAGVQQPPTQSTMQASSHPVQEINYPVEECLEMPIAIVSMGCVLPGAANPDVFWENVKNGVSGIIDLAQTDPTLAQDFLAGSVTDGLHIASDKTYTLLNGTIDEIPYDVSLLSTVYAEKEFGALTRGQRLLALALAQSLAKVHGPDFSKAVNLQCILGATADGSSEYDEARLLDSLQHTVQELDEPPHLRESFTRLLEETLGYKYGDSRQLSQNKIYNDVVNKFLSDSCRTYVVDSACSSSLYAINIGIKALRTFESDTVLAGGVFAPGPANSTLFAQFRGLTPNQSRPLDQAADGVVFGDGAAIVILKRLSDALDQGDKVLGVIRGMGLSSDGRSPSINVPQSKGQALAVRKAYERSHIDLDTIQYIEAHATATPVGDAVEFSALKEVMQNRDPSLPPIEIASVKALIGHTGWVSGVASIIKLCKAFESELIPKQYNYTAPNKELGLENSPFTISTTTHAWPKNIRSFPRRAGINGFGFGGTNAHVVLEAFEELYHRNLCDHIQPPKSIATTLAVVGTGRLFPAADKLFTHHGGGDATAEMLRFNRKMLRLPAKKVLLPDIRDHMDISQYLAALAAEDAFGAMPDHWQEFKDDIGVVVGMESKTERAVSANERIYIDRLRRLVNLQHPSKDEARILDSLCDKIRKKHIASGAYTLPGLMPNVAASRITHMFDLKGPNIVVDMGENSYFQALQVAQQFLIHKDCEMVLAGGIHASPVGDEAGAEATVMLALVTEETARRKGFPILALLDTSSLEMATEAGKKEIKSKSALNYKGAQGCVEMLKALSSVGQHASSYYVKEQRERLALNKTFILSPGINSQSDVPSASATTNTQALPDTHAYVQNTPIYCYTPTLVEAASKGAPLRLAEAHILFLADQPQQWLEIERSGALDALQYTVICPGGTGLRNSISIDLATDLSIESSLKYLGMVSYNTIIAVKDLKNYAEDSLLCHDLPSERVFLDLLFAVSRHSYESIRSQKVSLLSLCLNAYQVSGLNPYTGLVAGFMKSLVRELPDSKCRIVNTDESDFHKALQSAAAELGQPDFESEVCFKAGSRHVVKLLPVLDMAQSPEPYLDSHSVIIATGGGRGVTAVLGEELLKRFGCTVIALGRTDINSGPEAIVNMDEELFRLYESQFYKDELAKDKSQKIVELKRQYQTYQAVNEIGQTIKRLQLLPGHFEYICMDINDEQAVEKMVNTIYEKYGHLDLILHGAGVQISKMMTKKSVSDFRNIVATKMASLGYFYRASEKRRGQRPVHFHLLTSAFSYMGNDGQPDYGAANEAMNRIAASMNKLGKGSYWSSLAWLGWAGIGMTRGSEYAALAASRNLRGVTKEEGQEIFSALMFGPPAVPINILLADGEINFYKVDVQKEKFGDAVNQIGKTGNTGNHRKKASNDFHMAQWDISLENTPFLHDHVVNGIATAPAAFLTALVAETVRQLRPNQKILSFESTRYHKFVRVPPDKSVKLRLSAQVMSETEVETVIEVQVRSDFIHKNGAILQKDILHKNTIVRMAKILRPPPIKPNATLQVDEKVLPDPYVMAGSIVQLNGQFNSMTNIRVGTNYRKADYKLRDSSYPEFEYSYFLPNLIMVDSFWRFGAIHTNERGTLPLYVPNECAKMSIYFDFTDFDSISLTDQMIFSGENPGGEGDLLRLGNIEVRNLAGNILLTVEGAVCQKFGEIEDALTI